MLMSSVETNRLLFYLLLGCLLQSMQSACDAVHPAKINLRLLLEYGSTILEL